MKATVYVVVHGDLYQRYADVLIPQLQERFMPGDSEVLVLPGNGGWPNGSASRYQVALDYQHRLRGDWIFQMDADMQLLKPIGEEICGGGLTVTTHPGFPDAPDANPDHYPYCRNPDSHAYVPDGHGERYYPGAFVGGRRDAFLEMCETTMGWYHHDQANGFIPEWYEESYLNRYLLDHPPAVELDERYCWWGIDGAHDSPAILVHLNKTAEEFAERNSEQQVAAC